MVSDFELQPTWNGMLIATSAIKASFRMAGESELSVSLVL